MKAVQSFNLLLIFMFLPQFVFANAGLILEHTKTSDQIYFLGAKAHLDPDPSGYGGSYHFKGLTFDREPDDNFVFLHRGDLTVADAWTENTRYSITFGEIAIEAPGRSALRFVGSAVFQHITEELRFFATLERSALAENMRTTSLAGALLLEDRLSLNTSYKILPQLKLQSQLAAARISDRNQLYSYDLSAMYGVSPGWPWIWLGYGVYGLRYDEDRVGYWSPERFFTHGPRFDSSFPIYSQISGIFAANLNFYDENGTTGEGYLFAGGLQWGRYDGNNVRLMYTKIRSGQSQTPWVYEGIQLSCKVVDF